MRNKTEVSEEFNNPLLVSSTVMKVLARPQSTDSLDAIALMTIRISSSV